MMLFLLMIHCSVYVSNQTAVGGGCQVQLLPAGSSLSGKVACFPPPTVITCLDYMLCSLVLIICYVQFEFNMLI